MKWVYIIKMIANFDSYCDSEYVAALAFVLKPKMIFRVTNEGPIEVFTLLCSY